MSNRITYQEFADTLEFPPTPEQASVITSDAPAMLVIAGAGSGKTTTMSQRIAWKIVSGQVRPDQVLGLTFTHKAAGELAESAFTEIENARHRLPSLRASYIGDAAVDNARESVAQTQKETQTDVNDNFQNRERQNDELLEAGNLTFGAGEDVQEGLFGENVLNLSEDKSDDTQKLAAQETQRINTRADFLHAELNRPTISTYNSFAAELATSYAMLIGEDPRSRLITDAERWQIMEEIVRETPQSAEQIEIFKESSVGAVVEAAIALASAIIDNDVKIADLQDYLEDELNVVAQLADAGPLNRKPFRGSEASKGFAELKKSLVSLRFRLALLPYIEAYFRYKKEHSVIEFADQISWARKILIAAPAVGERLREQYKLVLLDEYQDTSVNQAKFLAQAFQGAESVCAVGDPNQAIYGWRGASANALADFINHFGVKAEDQLTLYTSFRNPNSVLRAANKITEGFQQTADAAELIADFADSGELDRPWLEEPITKAGKTQLKLPVLRPRNGAPEGKVLHVHRHLRQDSYLAMAEQISRDFAQLKASADYLRKGLQPTGAVLIRAHEIADDIAQALKEKGLEPEIVGGTPVITMPEIRAIRSLLQLCVSDTRSDCLIYLCNYFALGSADIAAFAAMRKQLAKLVETNFAENHLQSPASELNLLQVFELLIENQTRQTLHAPTVKETQEKTVAKTARVGKVSTVIAPQQFTEQKIDAVFTQLANDMSAAGWQRMQYLSAAVLEIRRSIALPIPSLIQKAAQLLQLPLLIASRPVGQAKVLGAINIFSQMSADYIATGRQNGLNGFLQWIDQVEVREKTGQENPGDDLALVEVLDENAEIPGKVAVLTIHAAKGLQWDVVAVPELIGSKFDDKTKRGLNPWHGSKSKLPDAMRADWEYIPFFSVQDLHFASPELIMQKGEAGCRYYDYLNRKLAKYYSDEQRRLAYVAFTRPKYSLILGSYDYESLKAAKNSYEKSNSNKSGAEKNAGKSHAGKKGSWEPTQLSTFLAELLPEPSKLDSFVTTYCESDPANEPLFTVETEFREWIAQFDAMDDAETTLASLQENLLEPENQLTQLAASTSSDSAVQTNLVTQLDADLVAAADSKNVYWPQDVNRSLIESDAANFQIPDETSRQIISEVRDNLKLLQGQMLQPPKKQNEISYFTASGIVGLIDDPETYLRNQLRPIPQEPVAAAQRGTIVHAQIASYYEKPQRFNLDEIADPQELKLTATQMQQDQQVQQLYERFKESRFASLQPLAIETSLELIVAGKPVRCVIDAVFDTADVKSGNVHKSDTTGSDAGGNSSTGTNAEESNTNEIHLVGNDSRISKTDGNHSAKNGSAVNSSAKNDMAENYMVTIVDWKSGRRPSDANLAARQFQLALYRHAWAHATGTPIENIDACFYYLGETDPAKRELHIAPISFAQMESQITAKLQFKN